MVGSKDLKPTPTSHRVVFFNNQFLATPQWPAPGTDLSGKTAIITGSNTGLGYSAASQLLSLKLSHFIMAVRNPTKGATAAAQLRLLHPNATIEVWPLDMTSYASIQSFARRVQAELPRIDITILNAGVKNLTFTRVESTGHEEVFQVDYLSTVLLCILLLPILKSQGPPNEPAHLSIVNAALTVAAAKFPNRDADPLFPSFDKEETFSQENYNSAKLLAHMFLWKLVDYVKAEDVIVNLADPAWVKGTEILRGVKGVMRLGLSLFELAGRTPRVGASCLVDAVVNKGAESHGCFLMSWKVHAFAPFLYTPEGQVVIQRAWDETMNELEFAGVRRILESLKG